MSKWVLVFLCCFAANAFASSADSGRCPWKIPFTIEIHADGQLYHSQFDDDPDFYLPDTTYRKQDSTDFSFTVDTSTSHYPGSPIQYSLNGDILRFSLLNKDTFWHESEFTSLTISFAPGKDSIISLEASEIDSFIDNMSSIYSYVTTFQISALEFDDTSIFATDFSFLDHQITMTDNKKVTEFDNGQQARTYDDFGATSVDLSGIFRPIHFADQPPAIVVQSPSQAESLSVTSLNGSLHCTFGSSAQERILEIYSPLGIKAASCSVPPGGTEAIVPHISPGFYFVRLGSLLAKVYVAE
jgi:hypothetical protein